MAGPRGEKADDGARGESGHTEKDSKGQLCMWGCHTVPLRLTDGGRRLKGAPG